MGADLDSARQEWEQAYRDLEEATRDPELEGRLHAQLEAITNELRRRVGGTFTLQELVDAYGGADLWARDAITEEAAPVWPTTLVLAEAAAFHLYSRGAVDYAP